MKRVTMYGACHANYKQNGSLKKRAQAEYGHTVMDVEPISAPLLNEDADIARAITKGRHVTSIESPYVFTHIAMRADGKLFIIYEEVCVGGQWITTSPTKLLEALKATQV